MYQVAPRSFEIHWLRQYLINIVFLYLEQSTCKHMTATVELTSNLYVGSVEISPNIWHWIPNTQVEFV